MEKLDCPYLGGNNNLFYTQDNAIREEVIVTQLALFGYPVTHSLSPEIQQAFAQAEGINLSYCAIETHPGQLKEALQRFKAQGGGGANITLPLKGEAFQLCARRTPTAMHARAVNTIYWQDEQLWGDNTDGGGLLQDLTTNLGLNLRQQRILLLGAGGAARGILFSLLSAGVEKIVIVNRTLSNAQLLALQDPRLQAYSYETLEESREKMCDLIINATSASLKNELPPLAPRWLHHKVAIDLAYKKHDNTIFLQWAQAQGVAATYDGIGMLIEQAALSFQRWFGKKPLTKTLIQQYRQKQ